MPRLKTNACLAFGASRALLHELDEGTCNRRVAPVKQPLAPGMGVGTSGGGVRT
jgi:hypothetical protein